MKKVLLLLVTLSLLLSSTGCSMLKKNKDVTNNDAQVDEVVSNVVENGTTVNNTTNEVKENETVSNPTNNATNNVVYTETPNSGTSNSGNSNVVNPSSTNSDVVDTPTSGGDNGEGTTPVITKPKDTTAPVITADDIVTEFRMEPLFDSISAFDETDGRVQVDIIGNYDIAKAGIYPMSAVAIDFAGNSAIKYFNVIVNEHPKQADLNTAEKDVIAKKELLDEAKRLLKEAREEYINRSNTLAVNEENLANLNNTLDDLNTRKLNAQDSLQNAKSSLNKAEELYNVAVTEYNEQADNLEDEINSFSDLLVALGILKDNILKNLNEAQGILENKNSEYNNAVLKLKSTEMSLTTETDKLSGIEDDYSLAVLRRDDAQTLYEEAMENVARKERAYNEAVYRATESEEFKQAQEELVQATEFLATAKETQTQAVTTLADAAINLDNAVQVEKLACKNLEDAKCNFEEANRNYEEAKKEAYLAKVALDKAEGDSVEAQERYNNAKAAIEENEIRKAAAEESLAIANKAYEKAEENLANAETAVNDALTRYENAQAVINSGSLGFFKSMDTYSAEVAADIIETRIEKQDNDDWGKTNLGEKGDATSLDNMKNVFDLIRKGNELRTADEWHTDNYDLLVNDVMMAAAQIQANASSTEVGHSHLVNAGENLAWGYNTYVSDGDPYEGWYTEEKLVWEVMNNKGENADGATHTYTEAVQILKDKGYRITCCGVGHYESLTNSYEITGLAYNTVNNVMTTGYTNVIGQTFSYGNPYSAVVANGEVYQKGALNIAYTVDEYEEMFNNYVTSIYEELEAAQAAVVETQQELNQLKANGGISTEELHAVIEAQAEFDDAKADIFIATNEKLEAENELALYQEVIDEKQAALDIANANLANALEMVEEATTVTELAEKSKSKAATDVETARDEYEKAQDELNKANQEVEDLTNEIQEKTEFLNSLNEDVNLASNELEEAKTLEGSAKDNLDNEQTVVDTIEQELTEQTNLVNDLTEQVELDTKDVEDKEDEIDLAQETVDNIKQNLEDVNSEIESTEDEIKDRQDTLDALKEEVDNASKEVDKFTEEVETLTNDVENLKKEEETTLDEVNEVEAIITENKEDVLEQEEIVKEKEEDVQEAQENYDEAVEIRDNLDKEINGGND